jgi:hypothetical protein
MNILFLYMLQNGDVYLNNILYLITIASHIHWNVYVDFGPTFSQKVELNINIA